MSSGAAATVFKKRERTQNWLPEEKNALFSLIKVHVNAIENKKIDTAASAIKTLAWQKIYCSFRGMFSTERDITRMREQWRRMKAQAKIEIYTFAEKVETLGFEEAAKSRPSDLSVEVWRLMENVRKSDLDADRSDDDSSQDVDGSTNLRAILDKLAVSPPEISIHEIKIEASEEAAAANQGHPLQGYREAGGSKRESDEPIDLVDQKRARIGCETRYFLGDGKPSRSEPYPRAEGRRGFFSHSETTGEDGDTSEGAVSPPINAAAGRADRVQKTVWIFEAAQKEHDLKIRMLNMELERAELQKQAAINDLKTSEIKKKLIESQAAEYYRWAQLMLQLGEGKK